MIRGVESRPLQLAETSLSGNPLACYLESKIATNGPVPFSDFMHVWAQGCVDENGIFLPGYYASPHSVIGDRDALLTAETVDFNTPSEISPVYGFMLAKQVIEMWDIMGKPDDFTVVEMGAGNGTLASSILHGLRFYGEKKEDVKALTETLRYIIVESSPTLSRKQQEQLQEFSDKVRIIRGSANALPVTGITGVFLSVELPDAFGVNMVRKKEEVWEELYIDNGDHESFSPLWMSPSEQAQNFLNRHDPKPREHNLYPVNLAAESWMKQVAQALNRGYVITVDYNVGNGNVRLFSSNEKGVDTTASDAYLLKKNVGICDLTAGVDFQVLAYVGKEEGLSNCGYVLQSGLLYGLGLDIETPKLPQIIAGRPHIPERTFSLLKTDIWKVLIQSKDVNSSRELTGLKFEVPLDDYYFGPEAYKFQRDKIEL